jgi:hypothetical protein
LAVLCPTNQTKPRDRRKYTIMKKRIVNTSINVSSARPMIKELNASLHLN